MSAGRTRVLVTDAGSTKALAVVRALGDEYDVWTTSGSRFSLAAWSRHTTRHVLIPVDPALEFARRVLDVCVREQIAVVVPPEERSSFLLARERARFTAAGVATSVGPLAALEVAMDKARTMEAAKRACVPAPRTIVVEDIDAAVDEARALGFPLVMKPRFSNYWAGDRFITTGGTSYASSVDQLAAALRDAPPEMPPPLIQEFVSGPGHGVFLMIGRDGTLLAEFAHERLRDLRPSGSGSVLRRSVAVRPALRAFAHSLLKEIDWRGAAMVEFRGDERTGGPKLMEINGRLWGSLQLATDAGVNFPKLLVQDALGTAGRGNGYSEGVVLRWWLGDLSRLATVFRGPPPGYTGSFPTRLRAMREFLGPQPPGTRQEILRRDDPMPALGELVSILLGRR